ncbi:hypothetical protein [Allokutzneria oryzae]|uniref:LPXTG cell wall anchor domain-containing protein n=1 Tax=Allokutzneria oryzae TaxID=1378989 RepID=A0ABV5ZW97_9PSEU
MRATSRAIVVTLFGVLALLAVTPVSSALPAPAQIGVVVAQQPTTTAPPTEGQQPAVPEDRNRVTIGIIAVVLLGTVLLGRRIRKRAQKA